MKHVTIVHERDRFNQPFARTAQFGICVQEMLDWMSGQRVNGLPLRPCSLMRDHDTLCADLYAVGITPPRFPPPAIPYEAWVDCYDTKTGKASPVLVINNYDDTWTHVKDLT